MAEHRTLPMSNPRPEQQLVDVAGELRAVACQRAVGKQWRRMQESHVNDPSSWWVPLDR